MGIIIFFLIWNGYACFLMYQDKKYAINHQWRISEKVLLVTAICFGGLGIWFGMKWFRHKTKHWYFKWTVPAVTLIQLWLLLKICI